MSDCQIILQLIHKKAEFDTAIGSCDGTLLVTEAKLQQTLFGQTPFAKVLLAEVKQQAVGFALYYFRYSSFKAQPSLWIDDLFVNASVRSCGVGSTLMASLAAVAREQGCSHVAWNAWGDNVRAVAFYKRVGGRIVEEYGKTLLFHWNGGES
ncbi:GNAT family N-acetyltransferase [Phormidium tenue FACHB-886]|nr:GNAT family N-acetyltransferase [Phormidium tenue FACHB-886]